LGIRFDMSSGNLQLYKPDGQPFLSFLEVEALRQQAEVNLEQTREQLLITAQMLDQSQSRTNALAAKLRELGINPDVL
jgi:hypothetical protein